MLKAQAGIDLTSIPYKSNAQALQDLRGGQIQMLFGDIALMLPQIRANAVRALGVSSSIRSTAMPDMPTLKEQGLDQYELVGFIAAFAPAKTPAAVVARLNEEMNRILRDAAFADSMTAAGVDAAPTSPAQLREFVIRETRKWADLSRAAGIVPK
jgi:tripartite-type tricarboxylate transporter receptor subunit TctC